VVDGLSPEPLEGGWEARGDAIEVDFWAEGRVREMDRRRPENEVESESMEGRWKGWVLSVEVGDVDELRDGFDDDGEDVGTLAVVEGEDEGGSGWVTRG
jgi:hypothetical protein